MGAARRGMVLTLRILGVAGILFGMVLCLLWLEHSGPVEPAEVIFLGTEEDADCILLRNREHCVMIDTGEEQDGDRVVSLMEEYGISVIDFLILTHPDKDHIGGAVRVAEEAAVRRVILPYYMRENERYDTLLDFFDSRGIPVQTLGRSRHFQLGDLNLRIFPPDNLSYNNDNDYSLVVLAEHGETRMLFAGDAQKKRIQELEQYHIGTVDLYKVPHHGRDTAAGVELIEAISPEIAVVTAREPEQDIRRALIKAGATVYCTVPERTVTLESDGKTIRLKEGDEDR